MKSLEMLGDFWTLSIIQVLAPSQKRFKEIEKEISGINPTTLSGRLKKLEKEGLVSRKEETLNKLSVVYALTAKGRGILPILIQIRKFSTKFL
ncbi:MAG TPA: helix-turn-helix domain-containing protein [Patescibacteria group bacterium]|nr:helix-turn-helix domain-containing protein [Patescibacteria group bacterium]